MFLDVLYFLVYRNNALVALYVVSSVSSFPYRAPPMPL
jgi:hypothetical protein